MPPRSASASPQRLQGALGPEREAAGKAWAASSTIHKPSRRAQELILSESINNPPTCTGMIPATGVSGEIESGKRPARRSATFRAASARSMLRVTGSQSTRMGTAPR